MNSDLMKTYAVECASGGVALVALVGAVVADAGAVFASEPVGAVATAVCALSSGVLCGSLVRRMMDGNPLAERDARIAELEQRPTSEDFGAVRSARDEALRDLASARTELASTADELSAAKRERDALAQEAERARSTAALDRFSDFQLLGMCDICDAEDSDGFLLRPYGDPAMEQLQALDAVAFDSSQGTADAKSELRWTLKPEWRQAVRAQRAQIDVRTRALRERRGDTVSGDVEAAE